MPKPETLPMFVSHVHALKGTCASMGALEVSEMAARLEAAGKAEDLTFVGENLDLFTARLAELARDIAFALDVPERESAKT